MSTLEDKILGEKKEYYCSSDEEEEPSIKVSDEPPPNCPPSTTMRSRYTENTGPKGVISDWQEYKKMQAEGRSQRELEQLALLKNLSLTGKTKAEDEATKQEEELDAELQELMSDEVLLEFQRQRMLEIMSKLGSQSIFGKVYHLTSSDEFLDAIEKEKNATVLVHIYDENVQVCKNMNKCLDTLAVEFPAVKFCKIPGDVAGVSKSFKKNAVPALLVYKKNQVIGNFVRVSDDLGEDFFPSDVENFLIENGMILEKDLQSTILN